MRTTRRPNEMSAVDAILGAVLSAGWTGADALVHIVPSRLLFSVSRVLGPSFVRCPRQNRQGTPPRGSQVYAPVGRSDFPHLAVMAS
jgi:hypothetical protein